MDYFPVPEGRCGQQVHVYVAFIARKNIVLILMKRPPSHIKITFHG